MIDDMNQVSIDAQCNDAFTIRQTLPEERMKKATMYFEEVKYVLRRSVDTIESDAGIGDDCIKIGFTGRNDNPFGMFRKVVFI